MMKLVRTEAVLEYSSFENARRQLLDAPDELLDRPLACWVQPTDRALPIVFVDQPVRDLLDWGFDRLRSTPGVGHKKLQMLVELLIRAAAECGPGQNHQGAAKDGRRPSETPTVTQTDLVSEVSWSAWRATVVNHNLGNEPLGLFADSLRNLARPVWKVPLNTYTGLTLEELRSLKTHGRKRVTAILEVFRSLYTLLSSRKPEEHLVVSIRPQNIDRLDNRVMMLLRKLEAPSRDEMRRYLVPAMVEQVRIDCSPRLLKLVELRFGLSSPWEGLSKAARKLNITRARVYQHMQELSEMMEVRWPEGFTRMCELSILFHASGIDPEEVGLFDAAVELFFSGRGRQVLSPSVLSATGE